MSKDHARNGLRNMRFRGEKIGGKVTIRSTIGKGTSVTLGSRVVRKKSDDMLIAIDLASIRIVTLYNLAEGAIKVVCRHCQPRL